MNKLLITLLAALFLASLSTSLKLIGEFYSTDPSTDGRCCSCCRPGSVICIMACCACPPVKENIIEETQPIVVPVVKECCSCCPLDWTGPCIDACCGCPS